MIAKSSNLAPYLKASATAVPNGLRPVASTGKVQKTKVAVQAPVERKTSYSLSQAIPTEQLRVRSGISGTFYFNKLRLNFVDKTLKKKIFKSRDCYITGVTHTLSYARQTIDRANAVTTSAYLPTEQNHTSASCFKQFCIFHFQS